MSEQTEFLTDGAIQWEREVRGYNRQQVDEYVAWRNQQVRELEGRLSQSLAEVERLRTELAEARETAARPAHEEISERVGQILKLAADEAKAERERVAAELAQLREAAKEETDKLRADAQEQAERMLAAAAEQSERSVSAAKSEAEQLLSSAQASAEQTVAAATKHAESTVAAAMAQAKQQLDEATARATAIHEGAERRLNLLISRHTETVRRLTEIRDVVTSLVAGEAARGSLEDEVTRAMSAQAGNGEGRPAPHDPHRGGQRQPGVADGRRHVPGQPGGVGPAGPGDSPAPGQPGRPAATQVLGRPGAVAQSAGRHRDPAEAFGDGTRHQASDPPTDDLRHPGDEARHPTGITGAGSRGLDDTAG